MTSLVTFRQLRQPSSCDEPNLARVTAQVIYPRLNGLDQSKVVRILTQTPSRDTSKFSCHNNITELLLDEVNSLKAPKEWAFRVPVPLPSLNFVLLAVCHSLVEGLKG